MINNKKKSLLDPPVCSRVGMMREKVSCPADITQADILPVRLFELIFGRENEFLSFSIGFLSRFSTETRLTLHVRRVWAEMLFFLGM